MLEAHLSGRSVMSLMAECGGDVNVRWRGGVLDLPAGRYSASVEWQAIVPAIIGAFVGVMGWLVVGIYIQRRQFMRQARNAAKAVYFELDVNLATISVAREHKHFVDLDRSAFDRLLPELATLLDVPALKTVVDAYMTHAGYRQLASRDDLPSDIRKAALATFAAVHQSALSTLRSSAFSPAERRAIAAAPASEEAASAGGAAARARP